VAAPKTQRFRMVQQEPEGYVSIIGFSYLNPIARLLETLESFDSKGPNPVQVSIVENGYSAAIIILTVLLVESAIARTQYVLSENPPKKPLEFVRKTYSSSSFVDKLEELFVVRDVIAHNHVWEAQFIWDDQSGMKLISATLKEGYGDKKYAKVLDPRIRKTRRLGINLFPTRICREDATTVLKNAVEFLMFLENLDRRYVYISPQYVKFRGVHKPFVELVLDL
jgi:hypothetical protein